MAMKQMFITGALNDLAGKIKPCPFCGMDKKTKVTGPPPRVKVWHREGCLLWPSNEISIYQPAKLAAWNMRHADK